VLSLILLVGVSEAKGRRKVQCPSGEIFVYANKAGHSAFHLTFLNSPASPITIKAELDISGIPTLAGGKGIKQRELHGSIISGIFDCSSSPYIFHADQAWLPLPGSVPRPLSELFYSVSWQPSMSQYSLLLLNSRNSGINVLGVSVQVNLQQPSLSTAWVQAQLIQGNLIVQSAKGVVSSGQSNSIIIDQVFYLWSEAPNVAVGCTSFTPASCPAGQVPAFTRNPPDNCLYPAGCVTPVPSNSCGGFVLSCKSVGYNLRTWIGVDGCLHYACDVATLFPKHQHLRRIGKN